MNQEFRKYLPNKKQFASKWLILAIDLLVVNAVLAIVVNLNSINTFSWKVFVIFNFSFFVAELISKQNTNIVRNFAVSDLIKIFLTAVFSVLLIVVLYLAQQTLNINKLLFVIHNVSLISILFIAWRLVVRKVFNSKLDSELSVNYFIYGASTAGILTFEALSQKGNIIGFIDDNSSIQGKYINGIKVYSFVTALQKIENLKTDIQLVIAIQNISKVNKSLLVKKCVSSNLKIKVVPAIETWIHGELTVGQIKSVKIEDLLGRDVIELEQTFIKKSLINKCVLVTGAAGSIGSEIVNQILYYKPKLIILFDQAETQLFELEQSILNLGVKDIELKVLVGNVFHNEELKVVFDKYKIDIIFHAAAYKHVPMMELNPLSAIKCNIFGTINLANLADEYEVNKFVFISTDKAINPTSVMGATKRASEIYIQAKNEMSKTAFITTRFGNVLGSNGSVIPQFKKQIENGGPVKVTHPDIARFFMTIPEACQLVLEAGSMGEGGEIFIFNMGESIKILDLAKRMILLSGLELEKDIEIEFTGLRPGEKLFEELLANDEMVLKTHNEKIMKNKVRYSDFNVVETELLELKEMVDKNLSENEIILKLKNLIPEYISRNSIFEQLDKQ